MSKFVKFLVVSLVLFFSISSSFAQDTDELLAAMVEAKFSEKEELVEKIGNLKTEFSLKILQSLENGTLYYIKENKNIVYAEKIDSATQVLGSYFLQDPLNFNGELTRIAIERSSSGEYLSNVE